MKALPPKRWPAADTSSSSPFCVLPNEVRCLFNVSAAGDSHQDSNCFDGEGGGAAVTPRGLSLAPAQGHEVSHQTVSMHYHLMFHEKKIIVGK